MKNRDGKEQLIRAKKFEEYLSQKFDIQRVTKQFPIAIEEQQRFFRTQVDILLETQQGMVVIQHDAFSGDRFKDKAESYADWAYWIKKIAYAKYNTSDYFYDTFPIFGSSC